MTSINNILHNCPPPSYLKIVYYIILHVSPILHAKAGNIKDNIKMPLKTFPPANWILGQKCTRMMEGGGGCIPTFNLASVRANNKALFRALSGAARTDDFGLY